MRTNGSEISESTRARVGHSLQNLQTGFVLWRLQDSSWHRHHDRWRAAVVESYYCMCAWYARLICSCVDNLLIPVASAGLIPADTTSLTALRFERRTVECVDADQGRQLCSILTHQVSGCLPYRATPYLFAGAYNDVSTHRTRPMHGNEPWVTLCTLSTCCFLSRCSLPSCMDSNCSCTTAREEAPSYLLPRQLTVYMRCLRSDCGPISHSSVGASLCASC